MVAVQLFEMGIVQFYDMGAVVICVGSCKKSKGKFFYSAVSSLQDRSKRFTH